MKDLHVKDISLSTDRSGLSTDASSTAKDY